MNPSTPARIRSLRGRDPLRQRLPRRRLPFEPILARFGGSHVAAAAYLGVHRRTIAYYERDGVPFDMADNWAITVLGKHPANVWGREVWFGWEPASVPVPYPCRIICDESLIA